MENYVNYTKIILEIADRLTSYQVPFSIKLLYGGAQLRFPWHKGDIICHERSYGHELGMVESFEFPWDEDDVSVLTPNEAVERIVAEYFTFKNGD